MGGAIGWVIIIGLAALLIWKLFQSRHQDETDGEEPERLAPHVDGDGTYEFDIVGEASYQSALDQIAGGKTKTGHQIELTATLIREPHNSHDTNAIAVLIDGRKVGYIARREAHAIANMMDRGGYSQFTADAIVVGGWSDRKGEGHYGVKLDLPVE